MFLVKFSRHHFTVTSFKGQRSSWFFVSFLMISYFVLPFFLKCYWRHLALGAYSQLSYLYLSHLFNKLFFFSFFVSAQVMFMARQFRAPIVFFSMIRKQLPSDCETEFHFLLLPSFVATSNSLFITESFQKISSIVSSLPFFLIT